MSERILIARNYDDSKPYLGIALEPNEMPVFGCNKKEIFCKYANVAGYCTMLTGDCSASRILKRESIKEFYFDPPTDTEGS